MGHKVWHRLRMQPQYIWLVGMIVPLITHPANFFCISWQVAVVEWVGLFVPLLLPLILQGVSGRGAASIGRVRWTTMTRDAVELYFFWGPPDILSSVTFLLLGALLDAQILKADLCRECLEGLVSFNMRGEREVWFGGLREMLMWVMWVENLFVMDSISACFPSYSVSNSILSHRYSWWSAWRLLQ